MTEGDATVRDMLQLCLDHDNTPATYLVALAEPYEDGTFDVKVSVRSYPQVHVLLVGTIILGGARVSDDSEFTQNAVLPVVGTGSNPLISTYKFDPPTIRLARIRIKTNIGSIVAKISPCPSGIAGKWQEYHPVPHTVQTPVGSWSANKLIPQSSCHPNCRDGGGDHLHFDFATPTPDISFINVDTHPQLFNPGGRDLYNWDTVNVAQPAANQLSVDIRSSTIATTLVMHADLVRTSVVDDVEKGDGGDITAGQTFTVKLRDSPGAYVSVTSTSGGSHQWTANNFSTDAFGQDQPSPWIVPASLPQRSSGVWVTDMKFPVPASCGP
jgi:hypothetical protein